MDMKLLLLYRILFRSRYSRIDANPETFVSALRWLRRVSFEFSHHSLRTKTPSTAHPLPHHGEPSFERNQSMWKIYYSYILYIYIYIRCIAYCVRHIYTRCVLLLASRYAMRVYVSSSSQSYIIQRYIMYICSMTVVYMYIFRIGILYTRELLHAVLISICTYQLNGTWAGGWKCLRGRKFRAREFETSAWPICRRHRQNALIIVGYICYIHMYLYVLTRLFLSDFVFDRVGRKHDSNIIYSNCI